MTSGPACAGDGRRRAHGSRDAAGVIEYYRRVAPLFELERAEMRGRSFWERVARETDAGAVLEVGCGTGHVARILLDRASRLVGVDISAEMLARARARLDDTPRGSDAVLVRGDVRRLPLRNASATTAVAADGVFSHLLRDADRDTALAEISRILRPGGILWLDGLWLAAEARRGAREPGGHRVTRELAGPDGPVLLEQRWRARPGGPLFAVRMHYRDRESGTSLRRARFVARPWRQGEMEERLATAGLQASEVWGAFDRRAFDPRSASRVLVRAVRP